MMKIVQAILFVVVMGLISIGTYYSIWGLVTDSSVPLTWRVIFILGIGAFVVGLIVVVIERLKTRDKETFRRMKW